MEHQQVYTREHTHEVYLLEHTSNGEPGTRSQTMIAAQDNSRSTAIELNHLTQGNHPLQGTECRLSLLHSGSREGRREGGEGGRRGREEGEGGGRRGGGGGGGGGRIVFTSSSRLVRSRSNVPICIRLSTASNTSQLRLSNRTPV